MLAMILAGNVADMLATCRPDSLMLALLADMALSQNDPDTTYLCWGWPTFTPFFFLCQSTYAQPAKNLYSTYVVLSTIQ